MNASYAECSLFLCPERHDYTAKDIPALITALQEIGFIADVLDTQETNNSYFIGDRFLDYIAYMGCSPNIQFESSENNDNFCFIKIHSYESEKLISSQKQSRDPHCPSCKKPLKDWRSNKHGSQLHCKSCNTHSNIEDFNWRKMAGYAQLFIEISDVFPKEAIPQQILLNKLTGICKVDWSYFYSCR